MAEGGCPYINLPRASGIPTTRPRGSLPDRDADLRVRVAARRMRWSAAPAETGAAIPERKRWQRLQRRPGAARIAEGAMERACAGRGTIPRRGGPRPALT